MNYYDLGKTQTLYSADKTADQMDKGELIFFIGVLTEKVEIFSRQFEKAQEVLRFIQDFYRTK